MVFIVVGTGILFMFIFHLGVKEHPRDCSVEFATSSSKRSAANWSAWFRVPMFYQVFMTMVNTYFFTLIDFLVNTTIWLIRSVFCLRFFSEKKVMFATAQTYRILLCFFMTLGGYINIIQLFFFIKVLSSLRYNVELLVIPC